MAMIAPSMSMDEIHTPPELINEEDAAWPAIGW
jgi:hypothetical protein